jgi:hypothetical protein
LKKGFSDGEEKASPNIKPECIIDNGDVVFMVRSLMVDIGAAAKQLLISIYLKSHLPSTLNGFTINIQPIISLNFSV